ncbi:MAG TPA: chromosome segregation protein SMC [Terriglobales bacterium]|nr:chromosome segregation protein SMC [Terriglobales bacterium]
MLKLKKLQILGFKSFCDRTELKFHGEGVAAIIGPNGCGKSNIADAISWVLGEQSAKTLRGSRMEDVIFAGSRDRNPTGMAEVSLTLIDPEVYSGADSNAPTEIEIQDDLAEENWDEAELRAQAAAETDHAVEEAQPGKTGEVENSPAKPADGGVIEGSSATVVMMPSAEGVAADATPHPGDGAGPISTGTIETSAAGETTVVAGVQVVQPQVVLKIRRRKFNSTPAHAGEIAVTRRLFRSGDSEYLLNGKLCRLRDIQELFMGTGLGPESYALIEQGRIGQILSSRPTDRRNIIEEAAGITKFKTKKRLAEARLEEAKQNLNRVNDIFEEVTRQMNSLKRQASKAERYGRLRDEMRAKLRVVLASKFTVMDRESAALDAEVLQLGEQIRELNEGVQLSEAEHSERTQRGYAIEAEARENRERLSQIAMETDRGKARIKTNEERAAELASRMTASEAEVAQVTQRLASLEEERAEHVLVLESAAADLAAAQAELALGQQDAAAAAAELAALECGQETCRGSILESVGKASNLRNQLTQSQERLAGMEREEQRLRTENESASAQSEAFGGQRGQLALEFETVSQRACNLASELANLRSALETKRTREHETKRHLDSIRAEYATALGKKGSLEAVIAEHGYSTESVRRLFQSGAMQGGHTPAGVLADFLEVEPRYERVVEDFLRDELNYVVVKSWDAADEGLRLLRSDVDGRATFLVHPEDSQAKFSFVADQNAQYAPTDDAILPLKKSIRVLNGFGRSLEVILPKLGNGYIVPDAAIGRELALSSPDAFFLSQTGECFHNVTVTGGKQRSEGPLSMKRELRDVMQHLENLERALRENEMLALTLGREIKESTSLLDRLEEEKREAETQVMTSGHLLKQLDGEMSRVRERIDVIGRELRRLATERHEQDGLIATKQAELGAVEDARAQFEAQLAAGQDQLAALRSRRDSAAETTSQRAARVATLEERHRSAAAMLQRIETVVAEMRERAAALQAQMQSATEEISRRQEENVRLAEQLIEFEAERNASEARAELLQCESEQVRARMAEIEETLRTSRQQLDAARDRRGELQAQAAKLASDLQHLADTCLNELNIERGILLEDATIVPLIGEELAAADQAHREMRAKLDAMGPVNMMALEEYKETAERHEFLQTQRKDLIDAIENTTATIKEIDQVSRQKFEEAFHKINANFQTTFRKLFGGGDAFMRLTDMENSAESGIDVVASPPGKKLQNVLLLSGGEKALTALALLVGIFQYTPSPFCILDEVDAPLDEANIGRFTELVREMSVQTQFILITHSKKTMSIAPVLYGVTMQEPGISKLVSVRFGAA